MKNIGLEQVFEKKVEFIKINSKQKNFLLGKICLSIYILQRSLKNPLVQPTDFKYKESEAQRKQRVI